MQPIFLLQEMCGVLGRPQTGESKNRNNEFRVLSSESLRNTTIILSETEIVPLRLHFSTGVRCCDATRAATDSGDAVDYHPDLLQSKQF
jgi:hypothetical protein